MINTLIILSYSPDSALFSSSEGGMIACKEGNTYFLKYIHYSLQYIQ